MTNARKFSWTEHFGNAYHINLTNNEKIQLDNANDSNYYIFNCLFKECTNTSAISIKTSADIHTLLEASAFYNCSSMYVAGSVDYECEQEGQFVQQQNCYYASKTESVFMAFVQSVKRSPSKKTTYSMFQFLIVEKMN